MNRAEFDALIDQALKALGCADCHPEFFHRVAHEVVECAETHNATFLGNRVADGELSEVEGFDKLTASLRPLYRAIGQDIDEQVLASIRNHVQARAGAKRN